MKIAFLGDIALIGRYDLEEYPGLSRRLGELGALLARYDFVVANLESPLTDVKYSRVPKSIHVRSSRRSVEILKELQIDALTLANNHIHDFGKRGMSETLATLEEHGIAWYGVNNMSLRTEVDGELLSFSGFSCLSANGTGHLNKRTGKGVHMLSAAAVVDQVERDRRAGALSVLSLHWGQEHTHYPNPEHVRFARELARHSPVIIHGHHPHVVQGVEKIEGSLVSYSLGNFIFDDVVSLDGKRVIRNTERNREGLILVVEVQDGRIVGHETFGVRDELEGGLQVFDISQRLEEYTRGLSGLADEAAYNSRRRAEFMSGITEKRGSRDLKWLLDRLNPNSVQSLILGQVRAVRYKRIVRDLENYSQA